MKCITNDSEQNPKVRIFDSNGNPLTDRKGVPLKNVNGELLVKFLNNVPVCTLNGDPVFDSNCLPFVESLDKPLCDMNGEPLRLYNQEGIPLTDDKGYALKLPNGKYSVQIDKNNRIVGDVSGRPLYTRSGDLFTHSNPDFTSKQQSQISTETNSINDAKENYYSRTSDGKVFVLYDCNKYPLTNSKGNVLRTVQGVELVFFERDGNAIKDCYNRFVYDASGNPSNSPKFDPYRPNKYPKKNKNCTKLYINIKIYDFRGYPLLDTDFSPLITSDGRPLVEINSKGELISDLNGYPVYDKRGIPLTKIHNCWTTPRGKPYRVYDITGFPLTNKNGAELFDINGNKLIKLDPEGRPVETASGTTVCDINGFPPSHPDFTPGHRPVKSAFTRKVYMFNKPMKVYNQNGLPLTDRSGTAMLDSKGRELIQFDKNGVPIKDLFGNRIYDKFRIPLNCHKNESIISMNGKPFRIYDKQGRPLTDVNGIPLNLANGMCTIKFDNAGRPVTDFRNSALYDFEGRLLSDQQANAEFFVENDPLKLVKKDGTPVQVYNREGMPLTDKNGIMLINSDGTHLRLNNGKFPVSGSDGEPVYNEMGQPFLNPFTTSSNGLQDSDKDIFGRPMKDSRGVPQFDHYGRPLYDLYRRKLYDEEGRPVANAYGRYLKNNVPEPKLADLGFDPYNILNCLANPTTASLTDLIGGPLFDCLGMPLYNQYGKPTVDIYGRSLYDINGLPLCDACGRPFSELIRMHGTPVEVKDVYKIIEVYKEVTEVSVRASSSGIWIMPSNVNNITNTEFNMNSGREYYRALVRKTIFADGKKSFEILEVKPHTGD